MPLQSQDSPLGAFLKALEEQEIKFILIGAMAAIEQGAPLMTVDYDFWVRLPERQYVPAPYHRTATRRNDSRTNAV
jgi:hypothetical protein